MANKPHLRKPATNLRAKWKQSIINEKVPLAVEALDASGTAFDYVDFNFKTCAWKVGGHYFEVTHHKEIRESLNQILDVPVEFPHPTTYRFVNHLDRTATINIKYDEPSFINVIQIQASNFISLEEMAEYIRSHEQAFPLMATFSLGGLPPLFKACTTQSISEYHLFPGLGWASDKRYRQLFTGWLKSIGASKPLLIFDTSFTGGAIGAIGNAVQGAIKEGDYSGPRVIKILGFVEKERYDPSKVRPGNQQLTHGCVQVDLTIELYFVEKIITEDFERLLGYMSLREQGKIEALFGRSIFEVVNSNEHVVASLGTQSLSSTFYGLRSDQFFVEPWQDDDIHVSRKVHAVFLISEMIKKEEEHARMAYRRNLLSQEGFQSVLKEIRGLGNAIKDKHFPGDGTHFEPGDVCKI